MNRRDLFKGILGLTGALALGKQVAPQTEPKIVGVQYKITKLNPRNVSFGTSGYSRVSSYIITDTRGRTYSTRLQTWADNT